MSNLIIILMFIICFAIVISGIIGFLMAFRPEAFSNDKKKIEKFRKFGKGVLIFFVIIFIIGFILMLYVLWSGFQHG